jgi:hypothetical protein
MKTNINPLILYIMNNSQIQIASALDQVSKGVYKF